MALLWDPQMEQEAMEREGMESEGMERGLAPIPDPALALDQKATGCED